MGDILGPGILSIKGLEVLVWGRYWGHPWYPGILSIKGLEVLVWGTYWRHPWLEVLVWGKIHILGVS